LSAVAEIEAALTRMLGRAPTEAECAIALDQRNRLGPGIYDHPLLDLPSFGPLRIITADDIVRHNPFAAI
jgi:hypothetical protein